MIDVKCLDSNKDSKRLYLHNAKKILSKGIKKYADTLSEKGGYCHFEANATYDCAICVAGMNIHFEC